MENIAGHCGKCGAPFYVESGAWFSVIPPAPRPTCVCWNLPRYTYGTSTNDYPPSPKTTVELEG